MGRLESVKEASTASLPRSQVEGGRWKSEEWERDEAFLSMIATRLKKIKKLKKEGRGFFEHDCNQAEHQGAKAGGD